MGHHFFRITGFGVLLILLGMWAEPYVLQAQTTTTASASQTANNSTPASNDSHTPKNAHETVKMNPVDKATANCAVKCEACGGCVGCGGESGGDEVLALRAEVRRLRAQLHKQRDHVDHLNDQLSVMAGVTPTDERLASTTAFIQESQNDAGQTIATTATRELRVTDGSRADHWINLQRVLPDAATREPSEPSTDDTTKAPTSINANTNDNAYTNTNPITLIINTVHSGGIYRSASNATLIINGQTLSLSVVDYDRRTKRTGSSKSKIRRDDETIHLRVNATQLQKIISAPTIEATTLQLGHVRFELTRDQVTAFRALAQYGQPLSP